MATSFICEHTAEYYLVPALKDILELEYEFVTPIFPWLNRELSSISRSLHKDDRFKVLVMFARRPKISDGKIYLTINEELIMFQEVGTRYGIPVIAGCPNSNGFWNLAKCRDFIWLEVNSQHNYDYLIPVELLNERYKGMRIQDDEIISLVKKGTNQTIDSFTSFINEARFTQPNVFFWGAKYKPVYFLIKVA